MGMMLAFYAAGFAAEGDCGFFEGNGTAESPYLMETADQLRHLSQHPDDWYSHFKMTGDIDLEYIPFTPIGVSDAFGGVFDGDGFAVHNFTPTDACASNDVGFFSEIGLDGVIRNLTLINPRMICLTLQDSYGAGCLAGRFSGYAQNCHVRNGTVKKALPSTTSGDGAVGGLFGYVSYSFNDPAIASCSVSDTLVQGYYAGGLAGWLLGAIDDCRVNNIEVKGKYSGGGIVGLCYGGANTSVSKCASTGYVEASGYAGGLMGFIAGYNAPAFLTASSSSCTVWSPDNAAGLVGGMIDYVQIMDCYCDGYVNSTNYSSGLVSCVWSSSMQPAIKNCYASAPIRGSKAKGLVSHVHEGTISVTASAWDPAVCGPTTSAAGTPLTTAQMQLASTYVNAGWDFENTWAICEGTNYPRLQWQIPEADLACPEGVKLEDFAFFAARWLAQDCGQSNDFCDRADLNVSGSVDPGDLMIFFSDWLQTQR